MARNVGRVMPARSATSEAESFRLRRARRIFSPSSARARATPGSGGRAVRDMDHKISNGGDDGNLIIHTRLWSTRRRLLQAHRAWWGQAKQSAVSWPDAPFPCPNA